MTSVYHITAAAPYQGVSMRQSAAVDVRPDRAGIFRFNIMLAVIALAALVVYVVQSNALAAGAWQLRDLERQVDFVRGQHDALVARRASLDDRAVLLQLAEQSGMVPATTVRYVFEDGSVAAR